MARIQQKTTGKRIKREPLDADRLKEGINESLKRKGLDLPRYSLRFQRKSTDQPTTERPKE